MSQLEHLKGQIGDLHRVIDVIHERGGAMYHAFNELRKHLEDIQRQIKEMHKTNYDDKVNRSGTLIRTLQCLFTFYYQGYP